MMFCVDGNLSQCKYAVARALAQLLEREKRPPLFLCIGSDKVTGDVLGPLVGDLLIHRHSVRAFVYGTLGRPVPAPHIAETLAFIANRHPNACVVAVDAALGSVGHTGLIRIFKGAVRPGSALNKTLPAAGDYGITANVSHTAENNFEAIALADASTVYALAQHIAGGIADALSLRRMFGTLNLAPAVQYGNER